MLQKELLHRSVEDGQKFHALSIKISRPWLKDKCTSEICMANCHIPDSNAVPGESSLRHVLLSSLSSLTRDAPEGTSLLLMNAKGPEHILGYHERSSWRVRRT